MIIIFPDSMTVWSYIVKINNANDNETNNQYNLHISSISLPTDTTSFVTQPDGASHDQSYICSGIPNDGGVVLNLLADIIVAGVSFWSNYLIF